MMGILANSVEKLLLFHEQVVNGATTQSVPVDPKTAQENARKIAARN